MIKVTKGNVALRVEDELLDFYVNKGYTAKSLDGKIIKEAVPTDMASLRKAYLQLKKENADLKKEIESFKSKASEKVQSPVIKEPVVSEDKPRRTRRKSIDEE